MPEEASQQEKTGVTHADLDRAAEEAFAEELTAAAEEDLIEEEVAEPEESGETEEVETAAVEEEEPAEEEEQAVVQTRDEDNAERSKLGRKVKFIEEKFGGIEEKLERLTNALERTVVSKDEPEEEDDAFITPENLPKYLNKIDSSRAQEQDKYQQKFVSEFQSIGMEDDNFEAIWSEFLANHNNVVTGDPKADAQIGYYKAKASVVQAAKPVNPVKGKGNKSNTSVNVPNKIPEKAKKPIKLDPVAAEFIKKRGLKSDFVEKVLGK